MTGEHESTSPPTGCADSSEWREAAFLAAAADPHEAYLAGGRWGPKVQAYRKARLQRAQRREQRRQMLALMVPLLAFITALVGKGFWGAGLQAAWEAASQALDSMRRGEPAAAATATYDALLTLASTATVKRLLLPILLTVVLRIARNKVIEKMNGSEQRRREREETREEPFFGGAQPSTSAASAAQSTAGGTIKEEEEGPVEVNYEWPRRIQHALSGLVFLAFFVLLPFFGALSCIIVDTQFDSRLSSLAAFLPAMTFLYGLSFIRRVCAHFNAVYVHLLRGIIRPSEKPADRDPSAIPFLWGCLASLLLCTRSMAVMCLLLVSFGDPAAALFRTKCKSLAAAAAAAAAAAGRSQQEAAEKTEGLGHAQLTADSSLAVSSAGGCRCNGGKKRRSKSCVLGIFGCTFVSAAAIVVAAFVLALVARHAPSALNEQAHARGPLPRFENPLLWSTLADGGMPYPWPAVLRPVVLTTAAPTGDAAAADFTVGSRLLEGEPLSWFVLLVVALGMGFVAAAAEAVTIGQVDDNLSMPLICIACFTTFFAVYVHLKGLGGVALGPQQLRSLSSFDLIVLLLFAV
ncbi:hypothetical protein Esti_000617 [Eimeria stiedai]